MRLFCVSMLCIMAGPSLAQNFMVRLDDTTKPASDSRATYEFQCAGKRYALVLETGEDKPIRVRGLTLPQGPIPATDLRFVQSEIDQFAAIEDVKLRCNGNRGYFEITGKKYYGKATDAGNTLIDFENGHVVH